MRQQLRGFNPRPRVGGDVGGLPGKPSRMVSIHAPVWGATSGYAGHQRRKLVSIHAPVWGATHGV